MSNQFCDGGVGLDEDGADGLRELDVVVGTGQHSAFPVGRRLKVCVGHPPLVIISMAGAWRVC